MTRVVVRLIALLPSLTYLLDFRALRYARRRCPSASPEPRSSSWRARCVRVTCSRKKQQREGSDASPCFARSAATRRENPALYYYYYHLLPQPVIRVLREHNTDRKHTQTHTTSLCRHVNRRGLRVAKRGIRRTTQCLQMRTVVLVASLRHTHQHRKSRRRERALSCAAFAQVFGDGKDGRARVYAHARGGRLPPV